MKVIHLISGGDSGGAKTHVLSLLQHLNQTITAQLVCFRDGPFAEEARQMGIPTMICGGNNVFRTRRKLAAYIREGGYEIIHCHGSRANMIGAMLRKVTGLPVVTTVHSDYRLDYMGRPLSHLTFGTINALALRRLDYRIGVSDAMVDLLISRGFPADRFYTIYNGIDFTPPPTQGDRLEYLRSLGADVDENSVVVGIAARMNPVKDMATLVRGFAAGHAKCPRLRLLIAGDGPEKDKLTALAAELGVERQVCFAGWISGGMDRFYSALDINALTSLSETFPYALTEGARFHLATVSTAVGGIPYLIDQDVNGYLFQPGDWQALGNDLAALGNDDELRRRLGEKLYEKASTQFSIQKTVSTQLQIYASILRRHRRRSSARDLRDKTNESSTMVNSGNLAVDSILNAKLPAARENGIRVSLRLEVPKMKTDPVDLCTLLGNLWDNAFEANMYLENHSERFIRLTVRPSDFFCSIHMENPVAPGREEQAESHESTKHLPGHGLGVGQIKKTVQKYDGVYSLRLAQPGRFVVDLLLPIDAAAPVEQVFVWESAKEALV